MARLRTAVIGVGHLGKEHARILAGFDDVELVGVVDVNFEQAQAIAHRCNTAAYRQHQILLDIVDAATIAVPTIHHFQIASDFLRHGIPILVEKPLTDSLPNAETLVSLAHRKRALLQVGHIERYNPAFEEIRRRGLRPKFIKCERFGPFSGRSTDIGVVLDLLIHDLDLLLDLVGFPVESTDAVGWTVYGRHEDVCHARLSFSNGCEAHVSASRASTAARRHMRIWTETGFAKVDFAGKTVALAESPDGQRHRGLELFKQERAQLQCVSEEAYLPWLRTVVPETIGGDQLTRELRDFVDCAGTDRQPRVSGEQGRDALDLAFRILDAVKRGQTRGRAVPWYPLHEGEAAA